MSSRQTHAPANAGRLPLLAPELAELVPLLEAGHRALALAREVEDHEIPF